MQLSSSDRLLTAIYRARGRRSLGAESEAYTHDHRGPESPELRGPREPARRRKDRTDRGGGGHTEES